jgi:putative FmdB family regulatory protein
MPIYEFTCSKDNLVKEEIRRLGDVSPPKCPVCACDMERVISGTIVIDKTKIPEKLKKRSEEQGKKFFRRYPQYQQLVTKTLNTGRR